MKHQLRELDTAIAFWSKLGVTIVLLILGVLLAPLFLMAPGLNPDPFANWIVKVAIDLIAGFYFVLLVYIWWRPKWLQRIDTEKK